jgi:hypothetical protein
MALKATYDKVDEIPEAIREDFEEREGKFHLKGFVPAEKVEDVSGLKSALGKERDNARKAAKELQTLRETIGDDFDPELYKTLKTEKEENERRKAEEKGQWDKLRGQITEQHAKELDKRKAREDHLIGVLSGERIDKEAALVCGELKGNATLLMPHIRAKTKLVEEEGTFSVRILDEAGNPRVNAEGKFLTIRDLVSEMQGQDVYAGAFAGTGKSGGGSSGNDGGKGGGGGGMPPAGLKRSAMSVSDKAKFIKEHGNTEYMKLPWA